MGDWDDLDDDAPPVRMIEAIEVWTEQRLADEAGNAELVEGHMAAIAEGQMALLGDDKQFHSRWPHWRGMPEYVMENQEPWASLTVRFASVEGRQAFFEAIGQPNAPYADGIWYPPINPARYWDLRYRDASEDA